jgi:hypothetical protein
MDVEGALQMTTKLEEIKKLATHAELYSDNNPLLKQLTHHTLNLVAALEKCQLQRNTMLSFYEPKGTTAHDLIRANEDAELSKILEGKCCL